MVISIFFLYLFILDCPRERITLWSTRRHVCMNVCKHLTPLEIHSQEEKEPMRIKPRCCLPLFFLFCHSCPAATHSTSRPSPSANASAISMPRQCRRSCCLCLIPGRTQDQPVVTDRGQKCQPLPQRKRARCVREVDFLPPPQPASHLSKKTALNRV